MFLKTNFIFADGISSLNQLGFPQSQNHINCNYKNLHFQYLSLRVFLNDKILTKII